MTFRFYRPDFAPLPENPTPTSSHKPTSTYAGTPYCFCKVPSVLRSDQKGKVTSLSKKGDDEDEISYFWMCAAGAQELGKKCGFFKVLDMRGEGRGDWFGS